MTRNDRARAAASHLPGSAGVISLDDRRAATLARIDRRRDEADKRRLAESIRKHPSNGRPT